MEGKGSLGRIAHQRFQCKEVRKDGFQEEDELYVQKTIASPMYFKTLRVVLQDFLHPIRSYKYRVIYN